MNKKHTTAVLLTLLTVAIPGVVAQDAPASESSAQSALVTKHAASKPDPVAITIEFEGGTMAQFVAAVKAEQPRSNIVLATKARDAKVPAISSKEAGLGPLLRACCISSESDYEIVVQDYTGDGEPVYLIAAMAKRSSRTRAEVRPQSARSAVYTLSQLTMARSTGVEAFRVETVMSALKMAMSPLNGNPKMSFHPESGLLMIFADERHLELVEQTMSALARELDVRESLTLQRLRSAKARPSKATKQSKNVK